MSHRVEITDKTYDRLKEYCDLNGLKLGQCADKFIFDSLMIEMYGDVPFTDYKKPIKEMEKMKEFVVPDEMKKQEPIPPEFQKIINEHWDELIEETQKGFQNVMKEGEENYLVDNQGIKAIDKETKDRMIKEMEKVEAENPQTYITSQEGEREIQREMLKELGIPTKVANKITKRRLK